MEHAHGAGVETPTLVMAGSKSPALLRDAAAAVASVLPGAEYRVLDGQGHNPSMKVQARILAEFIRPASSKPESADLEFAQS